MEILFQNFNERQWTSMEAAHTAWKKGSCMYDLIDSQSLNKHNHWWGPSVIDGHNQWWGPSLIDGNNNLTLKWVLHQNHI